MTRHKYQELVYKLLNSHLTIKDISGDKEYLCIEDDVERNVSNGEDRDNEIR